MEPENDVADFDALLIIAQRCYDMLSVIASEIDPEGFVEVLEMHKRGGFFGPPPAYVEIKEHEDGPV